MIQTYQNDLEILLKGEGFMRLILASIIDEAQPILEKGIDSARVCIVSKYSENEIGKRLCIDANWERYSDERLIIRINEVISFEEIDGMPDCVLDKYNEIKKAYESGEFSECFDSIGGLRL